MSVRLCVCVCVCVCVRERKCEFCVSAPTVSAQGWNIVEKFTHKHCLLSHSCTFYPLSCGNQSLFTHALSQVQIGGGTQYIYSFAFVVPYHK